MIERTEAALSERDYVSALEYILAVSSVDDHPEVTATLVIAVLDVIEALELAPGVAATKANLFQSLSQKDIDGDFDVFHQCFERDAALHVLDLARLRTSWLLRPSWFSRPRHLDNVAVHVLESINRVLNAKPLLRPSKNLSGQWRRIAGFTEEGASTAASPISGPYELVPDWRPGAVVVAVGSKRIVTIKDGGRLTMGEKLFGGYKHFYLVDRSPIELNIRCAVSSNKPNIKFEVASTLIVNVVDARGAVERGLTNLETLLTTPAKRAAASVALDYDVRRSSAAQQAIQDRLAKLPHDPAIKITDVYVDVSPDADAVREIRFIEEESIRKEYLQSRTTFEADGRSIAKDILSSPNELLAQFLVTKDEHYRDALKLRIDSARNEQVKRFEILRALIDNKLIEAHDLHQYFPNFIEDVLRTIAPQVPASSAQPKLLADERSKTDENDKEKK